MGFGLIFLGLICLLFFRYVPVELLGFIAIYKGLAKLVPYGRTFVFAKNSGIAMLAFSAVDAVLWFVQIADIATIPNTLALIMEYVHAALVVAFLMFLSDAFNDIATQCGYEKGISRAKLGKVLCLTYALSVVFTAFVPIVSIVTLIISLLLYIFYPFMTYGYYMMIVTDSILEKERIAIEAFDKRFGKKKNINGKK